MNTRPIAIVALLFSIAGCGNGEVSSCESNVQGSLDCRKVASRPASKEKVIVKISESGHCLVAMIEVACPTVGTELRKQYPDVNPRIVLCPDRRASYEPVGAVMKSIHDQEFVNSVEFGAATRECAASGLPPDTALERTHEG